MLEIDKTTGELIVCAGKITQEMGAEWMSQQIASTQLTQKISDMCVYHPSS